MEEGKDYKTNLNPDSLKIVYPAYVEPGLKASKPGNLYQFERQGYFCIDYDSSDKRLIFNRTVALRDSWAKISKKP